MYVVLCIPDEYALIIILQLITMPLDLSADEIFRDIAEQQAGRHGMGFQITDFNYNVGIIPNRTKIHLGDVCFEGFSVFKDIHHHTPS